MHCCCQSRYPLLFVFCVSVDGAIGLMLTRFTLCNSQHIVPDCLAVLRITSVSVMSPWFTGSCAGQTLGYIAKSNVCYSRAQKQRNKYGHTSTKKKKSLIAPRSYGKSGLRAFFWRPFFAVNLALQNVFWMGF